MKRLTFLLTAMALMVVGSTVLGASGILLVNVQTAPLAWGDPQIYEKLESQLSSEGQFKVRRAIGDHHSQFPTARNNLDSVVNWAQEAGGRYLMVVTVTCERLEKQKSFSLPLIFHKWETVAVIEGEMRLYDVARGKLLAVEPFNVDLKGKRAFQGDADDNQHDPNIHLTAVQKLQVFNRLEDKLASFLVNRTMKVLRGR